MIYKSLIPQTFNSGISGNVLAFNRSNPLLHAQLGIPDKSRAIKGLVVTQPNIRGC